MAWRAEQSIVKPLSVPSLQINLGVQGRKERLRSSDCCMDPTKSARLQLPIEQISRLDYDTWFDTAFTFSGTFTKWTTTPSSSKPLCRVRSGTSLWRIVF